MNEEKPVSIFDTELTAVQITRSNTRRHAMVIPHKKGLEFTSQIKKEMEHAMDIEEPTTKT